MTRLTKEFIDKVTPPEKGYKVHWDDKLKGFGLRVTAAGKKVFVVMGRVQGEQVPAALVSLLASRANGLP